MEQVSHDEAEGVLTHLAISGAVKPALTKLSRLIVETPPPAMTDRSGVDLLIEERRSGR
jgi:hypothetical protein